MRSTNFAGTGTLVRLILRRDRIRLTAWVLGIAALAVSMLPLYGGMFGTEAELRVMAETMETPAMVALVGPVFGAEGYHVGAMYAGQMLLFLCLLTAAMNILLVTRHTRGDEEQGRLEVIRSLPVGRLGGLSATLLTALGANLSVAMLTGLGLSFFDYSGITPAGPLLFGAVLGACGLFFAAATGVICQLTANTRTATGLSFALVMLLYLMRAAGDLGNEPLSLASPLGLLLRSQVFVADRWPPVLAVLALAAGLAAVSVYLARTRDLGQGLLPQRPGRRHGAGWLGSPLGLALRLGRTTLALWTGTVLLFAAAFASVFGDMEAFFAGSATLSAMFSDDGAFAEQYIALIFLMMGVLSTVPALGLVLRVRDEERQGFAEHLLGRSVSRAAQFGAYLLTALGASVLLQAVTALGFWAVASTVMEAELGLGLFLRAAAAYLPAMWVVLGLAGFLAGCLPRLTGLAYGYLGLGFFLVYVGAVVRLPSWTKILVPYSQVPAVPAEPVAVLPLAVMAVVAAALMVSGLVGYRSRDMVAE